MKKTTAPWEGAADGGDSNATQEAASEPDDIAAQLRRRREASKRLPPLASGKRDPWDLESYYDPVQGGA